MRGARVLVPAGIVLASVALGLALAARSRGGARREMTLSEREVTLTRDARDGSAAWASLSWNEPGDTTPGGWVGMRRLAALGVDTVPPPGGGRPLTRSASAFAVLELDGPAYAAWRAERLARVRALQDTTPAPRDSMVAREEHALADASRLVLVDVGPDGDALAAKYPDGSRYLIVHAVVRAFVSHRQGGHAAHTGQREPATTHLGSDVQIEPTRLLVTGTDAAGIPGSHVFPRPPAEVHVATGRGYVPWVTAVRLLEMPAVRRDTSAATAARTALPPLPAISEGEYCEVKQTPGGASLLEAPAEATPFRPDTNCAR